MTMPGTSLYCGDNCNHIGPHRYAPVVYISPQVTAFDITVGALPKELEVRMTDEAIDDLIPEGEDVGDDPVREPISEDDPRVGHEPVEE